MRSFLVFLIVILPFVALAQSKVSEASESRESNSSAIEAEVKATFVKFVEAQNGRDEVNVSNLLRIGPDFLWITTTAAAVWGHDEAMHRFLANWKNQWKLDPDMQALRVVAIGPDTALLNTPMMFTFAPQGQEAKPVLIKWSGVFMRTPEGWRIASILLATVPH